MPSYALENPPRLQQPLEVGLPVVLELHLASLAAGTDRDARRKALLELRFPFAKSAGFPRARACVLAAHLARDEGLRAADREPLGLDVAGGGQLVPGLLQAEQRTR